MIRSPLTIWIRPSNDAEGTDIGMTDARLISGRMTDPLQRRFNTGGCQKGAPVLALDSGCHRFGAS